MVQPTRPRSRGAVRRLCVVGVLALLMPGCTSAPDASRSTEADASARATPSATPPPTLAERRDLRPGWGPSEAELQRAAEDARGLKLPDLAGQVIVASYRGSAAPVAMVKRLHLGGVIAFTDNVRSPEQIRAVNRALTRQVPRRWPLFLGVDQEGGIVERVKGSLTRFPAFMSTGAADDPDLTRRVYAADAAELRGLGFTVDFAPVADVTIGPADPTIGARSASSRPALVARQAVAAAQGFLDGGVVPTLKHFPGHGSVPTDSHLALPMQTKSMPQLRASDLVPFEQGIKAGLPAVMVSHIALRAVDRRTPSSLSRPVITGLLRERLGFQGLVVTDALDMGAVRPRNSAQAAVAALKAGADIALMPADPAAARAGLIAAVRQGRLKRVRLEQAAARQIALLRHTAATGRRGTPPGAARGASAALSAAALTSVAGPCQGPIAQTRLVPMGDPVAVANFKAAAAAAGLPLGQLRVTPQPDKVVVKVKKVRIAKGPRKGKIVRKKVVTRIPRPPTTTVDGTRLDFLGYRTGTAVGPILVATSTPYALGSSRAPVRLATFGNTPGAMRALVSFLQGKSGAPGRLPVRVVGVEREGC